MRRRDGRLLQGAVCVVAAFAVLSAGGCGGGESDVSPDPPGAPMSEGGFVEHMAALTVAVQEGLSGDAARIRVAELGAPTYTREEIEAFARTLEGDPERWAGVALRIDRRIGELEGEASLQSLGEPDGVLHDEERQEPDEEDQAGLLPDDQLSLGEAPAADPLQRQEQQMTAVEDRQREQVDHE